MPRKPRFYLPSVPVHLVQRGHCKNPIFFDQKDYVTYLHWLKEASIKYEIAVHAFVLMTNHVHLLVTPNQGPEVSLFMQFIGRRYVPYINHKYERSGSLWEGRYKASLVQVESYFLNVMKYIELNPVRAGMVEVPGQYRWSSYCHNSGAKTIKFIEFHPAYLALGPTEHERAKAYLELFKQDLTPAEMKRTRDTWQTGTPLGSRQFIKEIERLLARKVGHSKRGRPTKANKGL